ncbi:MAG: FAD-dependent oxidoreductase [Clostridia bacterium]|nr:FAD-dependent oxidoreductase [Clostridia bacterium]
MDMRGMDPVFKGSYDVIVVGGGIAGVAASVSAARAGASVLLLEKQINLGGLATGGLISWYEPLCDGEGKQMIHGIAEELIKLSAKYCFDNLPETWGGRSGNKPNNQRYSTYFSPTVFSAALDGFVIENGVQIRFDSLATYPVMNGNVCEGVIVESVNGREFFAAKVVIDATGDASVMHRAGVPTVVGENFMTYIAHYYDTSMAEELVKNKNTCVFRKWINTGSDMYGNGHPQGMRLLTGVSCEDITDYVIAGKKNLLQKFSQRDKNTFDVMTLPTMPQFRTIRRIVGKTDFRGIDGETFADSIGNCGDFRAGGEGKHYQIPFGSLYNESFPNLLAAGRIISAPQGDGWEVARVIPTCALTGEVAGRAAAQIAVKNQKISEINIEQIRVN